MDLDLTQIGDQVSEKLKETSNMTRNLACKILERVREFKENFSGWDSVSAWVPGSEQIIKKVYHRQPQRSAGAASTKTAKTSKAKKTSPKKTASKGRTKRTK